MATNDFLVWDTNNVNKEAQATYAGDTARLNGVASGTASSSVANKTWAQSSIIAAMIAQFIANQTGQNSVDDGTTATLLTNFLSALSGRGAQNFLVYKLIAGVQNVSLNGAAFTPTGATTLTPAYSGTARVRIIGGGGGSGGAAGSGASGGGAAGSYGECYVALTAGTPITVTVGAAGVAGASTVGDGGAGGNSVFGGITAPGGGGSTHALTTSTTAGGLTGGAVTGTGVYLSQPGSPGGSGGSIAVTGGGGGSVIIPGQGAGTTFGQGSYGNTSGGADTYGVGGGGCLSAVTTGANGSGGVVIVVF